MTDLPLSPCPECGGTLELLTGVESILNPDWAVCTECLTLRIVEGTTLREPTSSELFPVPQSVTDRQMAISDANWKAAHPGNEWST